MWSQIISGMDIAIIQKDIDNLFKWSRNKQMNFHPNKCKVLSMNHKPSPLAVTFYYIYHYYLGDNMLAYADFEKDLGVD